MAEQLPPLIQALHDPRAYPHPVAGVTLIETHISWVLLTGDYAYKLKKSLDLGFLDFSTLAKRQHWCEEELRLNRRLAPALYLEVVPICGSAATPRVGGPGPALEYAVKMHQFDPAAAFDRLLARGALTPEHIDALAHAVARFHAQLPAGDPGDAFGTPAAVLAPMRENFRQIRQRLAPEQTAPLTALEQWTHAQFTRLEPLLTERRAQGFVRECHGDLHLANVAWIDQQATIFDCIEFNAGLRWIDVISEIAFVTMDLEDRGQTALAWRFLNTYLEDSGDYAGLALLRFYQGYRALVRAKVAAIRLSQPGLDAAARAHGEQDYQDYVRLAERYTRPTPVALLITHGVSGCGKTTLARQVLELVGAIRLRSDIERKRLLGLAPLARTGGGIDQGPYSAAMSARTYARLAELAQQLLQNGFPVIVDATFLKRAQRDAFRQPAAALTVPFRILDLHASHAVLIDRLAARARHIRDASEADRSVLTHQLATREPLGEEERTDIISFDADQPVDLAVLARQLTPLLPTM